MKKILALTLLVIILTTTLCSCSLYKGFNEDDYNIKKIYVEWGDSIDGYYWKYAKEGENYREAILELNDMRSASDLLAGTYIKVYVAK